MRINYRLLAVISLITLFVYLHYSGVFSFITLDYMKQQRLIFTEYVDQHYVRAVLLYMLTCIMIVVLALPATSLAALMGGFLFGGLPGALYALIGATTGATIFFLIVRHSLGNALQKKYHHKFYWFNKQMHKHGTPYLIAIHFIVIIPFSLVNVLLGLTRVPLRKFVWTTIVGIMPGKLVYAFAGQQFTTITSLRDIFSTQMIIIFSMLAILGIVPILLQHYRVWDVDKID